MLRGGVEDFVHAVIQKNHHAFHAEVLEKRYGEHSSIEWGVKVEKDMGCFCIRYNIIKTSIFKYRLF